MKKSYAKPFAEKVEFNYNDQVVAASSCSAKYGNAPSSACTNPVIISYLNDHT